MKKEEFKEYLSLFYAKGTVDDKVSYCNKAEKILGDLEDVVHDFLKIAAAQNKLAAEPSQVRKAFLDYIGFTYSPKIKNSAATIGPKKSGKVVPEPKIFASGPIVQYRDDVPAAERDEALREALELEYPYILQYASKILAPFVNGNMMPYIPVYLSKETPQHERPASRSYINKLKKKAEKEKELTDEEWRILETKKIRNTVLGRFFSGTEPYIEIYYRHLSGGTKAERIAEAKKCLAHEYMHFLHCRYATQHGVANPFENENLSEALADCFGVLYSRQTGDCEDELVAQTRYMRWNKLKGSGWPYAYAIYCFPKRRKQYLWQYNALGITKAENNLRDIFGLTKDSKAAFGVLMR